MPSMKSENPISLNSPSAPKAFFLASRPKTWIAGLSPVFIGAALAPAIDLPIFVLTLLFSLFIQIGTNYANDYFDFIKGSDNPLRNGPKRAVQQGWIQPNTLWVASLFVFALAFLTAVPLMMIAGLWSLFLAAACIAFGILYTGGPKPIGYLGLGELFVFVFFGPVATCGTYFLQTGTLFLPIFIASLAPGFLSCSILIANNLRDEKCDFSARKNTLVVRFGRTFGRWEYTCSILLSALVPLSLVFLYGYPFQLLLSSLSLLFAFFPIRKVFSYRDPLELISLLPTSAALLLFYTLLFCLTA